MPRTTAAVKEAKIQRAKDIIRDNPEWGRDRVNEKLVAEYGSGLRHGDLSRLKLEVLKKPAKTVEERRKHVRKVYRPAKAVFIMRELIPGENKWLAGLFSATMAEYTRGSEEESLSLVMEELYRDATDDEETPGLFYFQVYTTHDSMERIRKMYKGERQGYVLAIIPTNQKEKVYNAMYVLLATGSLNRERFVAECFKLVAAMQK